MIGQADVFQRFYSQSSVPHASHQDMVIHRLTVNIPRPLQWVNDLNSTHLVIFGASMPLSSEAIIVITSMM